MIERMSTHFLDGPLDGPAKQTWTPLEAALDAIQRGWFVFPLVPGTKKPILPWRVQSSKQKERVLLWGKEYPGCNWGVDCGKSGLIVLDVDAKAGTHKFDGNTSLELLQTENSKLPEVFCVLTPCGGRHYFFTGEKIRKYTNFRDGLDLQADGAYVVLYGSIVPLGAYTIHNSMPVATCPMWLRACAKASVPPRDPKAKIPLTDLDKDEYVKWAIDWLCNEAPDCVEGQGGNSTLYKVGCHLRDGGVSETKAVELLLEHYNESKCYPVWTDQEIAVVTHNAYKYALSAPGSKTLEGREAIAAEVFKATPTVAYSPPNPFVDDSESEAAPDVDDPTATFESFDVSKILTVTLPRRRWIMYSRLARGFLTMTVAPGGTGKSNLSYLEALAVATGLDLCGKKVVETGPCLLYNAEDDLEELQRRFLATCLFHRVDPNELGTRYHRVHLISGANQELRMAHLGPDRRTYVLNEPILRKLERTIVDAKAILFVGDPFVALHDVPENDNVAAGKVAKSFSDMSKRLGISFHLIHHTRKLDDSQGETVMDDARGASSVPGAVRIQHNLNHMGEKTAKSCGIDVKKRFGYVSLRETKNNLCKPSFADTWFKKVEAELPNGEFVGTLQWDTTIAPIKVKADGTHPVEIIWSLQWVSDNGEMTCSKLAKHFVETHAHLGEKRDHSRVYRAIVDYMNDQGGAVPVGEGKRNVAKLVEGPSGFLAIRIEPLPDFLSE